MVGARCSNRTCYQSCKGGKVDFRAIIVVGNEQGKVGVGVGKAGDVITAVKKGVTDGKNTSLAYALVLIQSRTQQVVVLVQQNLSYDHQHQVLV